MSDKDQTEAISENYGREHIEGELLGESIGGLSSHINRKQALADERRYAIVYIVYRYGKITEKHLTEVLSSNGELQEYLTPILNCNLIAEVSCGRHNNELNAYYRITKLGEQNITADITNITSSKTTIEKGTLEDPYLPEMYK